MSLLQCLDFGSMLAFSGNDVHVNDPKSTAVPNNGPLPHGRYYIVDRQTGGRHGQVIDTINDSVNGTRRRDWFALYTATPPIGDAVVIRGVRRANFRIHPVGFWGVSEGCITLPNVQNFYALRGWLLRQKVEKIPGTEISYYGTVTVV